ncbi:ornithine cyclodeaminase family protein [Kitasatospora sp. NPDC052896]|uniref:ornithine cyclodeaminase family protein n=1 Tax=Kitasatospora sp. NPDC052896 TaxID=3364061 RepID=UPI0037C88A2D
MSAPGPVLPVLPADLTPEQARAVIVGVLLDGLDPEQDPPRSAVPVPAGELLLMPAVGAAHVGVKIAGVVPGNPGRGLPRITGGYLLLDGPTLRPLALLDAAALTALRTPAVTAAALDRLADPAAAHLVLFGAGPQAHGHLAALCAIRALDRVTVVARRAGPSAALLARARALGLRAEAGRPDAVARADLVVCCTSSGQPLFDGALVPDHAVVAAIGAHRPRARETDTALVRRAACYVEARSAARREAGDLLLPWAEGEGPGPDGWANLAELLTSRAPVPGDRPRLFKGVGMAWQDLALAAALHRRAVTGAGSAGQPRSVDLEAAGADHVVTEAGLHRAVE